MIPLSTRMRPDTLENFVGQEHFMYEGSLFYNSIKNRTFDSAIFFGPSGTGKTTLARIIAREMDGDFHELNASVTGTKELKELIERAKLSFYGLEKRTTYVYVDEVHRWNKLQQDSLLKALEEGVIKFIGSTTENPYFSINNAVISRVRNIYEFRRLSADNLVAIIRRALEDKERGFGNLNIKYETEAVRILAEMANGDARVALDTIGFIVDNLSDGQIIDSRIVSEAMQRKVGFYDKEDDRYNLLSALQKSVRGSDPDAAVHYLARLLEGGELEAICRRLQVIVYEDIGLANSSMGPKVVSACIAAREVGMPEATIILGTIIIEMALSPKSNSGESAIYNAINTVKNNGSYPVPSHIKKNNPAYKYPHNYKNSIVKQEYLPKELKGSKFYIPRENTFENKLKIIMENLEKINK